MPAFSLWLKFILSACLSRQPKGWHDVGFGGSRRAFRPPRIVLRALGLYAGADRTGGTERAYALFSRHRI